MAPGLCPDTGTKPYLFRAGGGRETERAKESKEVREKRGTMGNPHATGKGGANTNEEEGQGGAM